jgi:hypothetical protein
MQGVAEEVVAQQANVDADEVVREAGVEAAKQALRDALNARLADSIASLDATVARLAQELLDREDAALEGVEADRAVWEQAIDDLRAKLLWDIKEIVWRLGYTQGYVYGAHDGHDQELLADITAKKDEYEAAIVATLQRMEDRVHSEQDIGDAANDAAWAELQGEFDRLTGEMNQAITDRLADCEQILADARASQEESIQTATDALYAFIQGRCDAWAAQAGQERNNAEWQEDSYYRYNLIRLLQAKQDAIDAAKAVVKAEWAASMQSEREDGMAFRSAQRDAFRHFTEDTAAALAAAIAQDTVDMDEIVATRVASLDARLDEQQTALEDAMAADREEMRKRLKEVYNYNTYEFDQATPISDHISAPYSHEQHRAFLQRFAYYMKDVLAARDATNVADENTYTGAIAEKEEASVEQVEDLERAIQDQNDAANKACERHADNLLEAYAESQSVALEMLQDFREAEQASASSEAARLQKQIIYAMHIIRYAGGRDSGTYGFGNAGSSYYGKGNSLTGIAALDDYRLPNAHGYAQVAEVGAPILKLNNDAENRTRQEEALVGACEEFDAMVQACSDRMHARVADEKAASDAARQAVDDEMAYATSSAEGALAATIADSEDALAAANDDRQAWLAGLAQDRVDAMRAAVAADKAQVAAWMDDQAEWAAKLYDSYYKEHLLQTLQSKRDETNAALDARVATSEAQAAAANAELQDNLDAQEAAFADFNAAQAAHMAQFNADLRAATAAAGAATNDAFAAAADGEDDAKNAFLDQMRQDWAYWLKYLWGYSGYDTALYADYDDTADYSHGGSGAYTDVGYQGHNGQSSGIQDGFGYGGIGGTDYLDSYDSLGLAYGSVTGPSPDYYNDSILDPADDLTTLLEGYSASYGKVYW